MHNSKNIQKIQFWPFFTKKDVTHINIKTKFEFDVSYLTKQRTKMYKNKISEFLS